MEWFTPAESAVYQHLQQTEAAEEVERAVVGCEISLMEMAIAMREVRVAQIHHRQAQLELARKSAQLKTPTRAVYEAHE